MGIGIVGVRIILLVIGIGAYLYVNSLKAQAEQGLADL